jgi:hypothetical protein
LPRLDFASQLVLERRDPIDPRLDAEGPVPGRAGRELAAPRVVAERLERRLLPARCTRFLEAHRSAEHLVSVTEDRRGDDDRVVARRLHRKASAVGLRLDVLDLDAGRRLCCLRWH